MRSYRTSCIYKKYIQIKIEFTDFDRGLSFFSDYYVATKDCQRFSERNFPGETPVVLLNNVPNLL